jgi:integrase
VARKPKARGNGEGSIFEYPKGSDRWYAQVTLANGRVRRRLALSQRGAREKLRQLQAELEQGIKLELQQPTVAEWCKIWLDTYAKNLKPNIREDYRGVVRRYIEPPPLGKIRLNKLTPAQVQDWVDSLGGKVSAQTVRGAHARLHKALEVAVKRRYIIHNVAADTELPAARRQPIKPLDFAQTRRFLAQVKGHRWAALYRLAVNLGMREGELLGLTWDVIDFKRATIRVSQQLRRVPDAEGRKQFVLQSTKTEAGERTLWIDEDLVAVLREHRANQDEERQLLREQWGDPFGNLVFVSDSGRPIHASNLVSHFKKTLAAAGLPIIRFHDLRHTAATLMLADSVPLVTVSKILGHSSVAVTARIYAHALEDQKGSAIATLSQKLKGE